MWTFISLFFVVAAAASYLQFSLILCLLASSHTKTLYSISKTHTHTSARRVMFRDGRDNYRQNKPTGKNFHISISNKKNSQYICCQGVLTVFVYGLSVSANTIEWRRKHFVYQTKHRHTPFRFFIFTSDFDYFDLVVFPLNSCHFVVFFFLLLFNNCSECSVYFGLFCVFFCALQCVFKLFFTSCALVHLFGT